MKKVIELVWHNCKTNPPKEIENDSLIVTDGLHVYGMSWHRAKGYFIEKPNEGGLLSLSELENWWWADIEQTVQGETIKQRFL